MNGTDVNSWWFWSFLSNALTMEGFLFGGAVLILGVWMLSRRRRLPPGPRGIPWIGIGSQLTEPLHVEAMRMRQEYNSDIISFTLHGQLTAVLHGYQLIKDAFSTRGLEIADRPCLPIHRAGFVDEIITGSPSKDKDWATKKKFAISVFRNYGYGTKTAEDKIHSEFNKLLEFLRETNGVPVDMARATQHAIARVITNLVYSSNYLNDDPEVDRLIGMIQDCFATDFSEDLMSACVLPTWLMNIVNPRPMAEAKKANQKLKSFMMEIMKDHKASLDQDNPRDMVDAYLIARKGTDIEDSTLVFTLIMFYFDGIETLHTVAMEGILQIVANAKIQDKLQEELDEVVGRSGRPRLSNKPDLKYLQAIVLESLRISNSVPLGVEHSPQGDIILAGYDIPRGSSVFASLYSVHMDPDIFSEPEQFSPEHFLNDAGEVVNSEYCIPFSIGRRMCIGDQMSKTELFLLFAGIFHEFRLSLPPEKQEQTKLTSSVCCYLQKPPSFDVCAVPR